MAKPSWKDRIWAAFGSRDAEGMEEALKEGQKSADADDETEEERKAREAKESSKTGDAALKKIMDKLQSMDADIQELKKERAESEDDDGEVDDPDMTADTVIEAETARKADVGKTYTGDALRDTVSRAEILAPGLATPTTDGVKVADAVARHQRRALKQAMATDAGKAAIAPFLNGRALDKLTGDALHAVFIGASELMKTRNNDTATRSTAKTSDFGGVTTVAKINEANAQYWQNRK